MTDTTVLLVDDEPALLQSLQSSLRQRPWRVLLATDARAALDVLEQVEVAVVVCDHDMPGMSGAVLLRRIADLYPGTVRIMLTGRADLDLAMRAINDGEVYRFFTKPFAAKRLAEAIAAAVTAHAEARRHRGTQDRRSVALIAELERTAPGLTRVDTSSTGAIVVSAPQEDLQTLLDAAARDGRTREVER